MKKFKQTFSTIELCLTYRCNLHCNNCSNLCSQAPYNGDLTPCDINFFIEDIDIDVVKNITLHGGEPVLNPYIDEIIFTLSEFNKKTGIKLWLLSNGSPNTISKANEIKEKYGIQLGVAPKDDHMMYVPVNESPIDLGEEYNLGCFQIQDCGLCYNYLGYFPCSPMGAAARVFGYLPMAKKYDDINIEMCLEYYKIHCKHCGFSMPGRRRVKEQTTTKTWYNKLTEYN